MGTLSVEVRTEVLCGRICDLEAENAKLLDFAQLEWRLLTSNNPMFTWKDMVATARELGIEVDE